MEFCLQGDFQVLDYKQLECVNGGGSNFWDGVAWVAAGAAIVATAIVVVASAPLSVPVVVGFAAAYTLGNAMVAVGGASAISGAYNNN